MTVAQLTSVLGITSRRQRKKIEKLCIDGADADKVAVLFHIDNVYVDSIFQLDNINSATIDGIKRDFVVWVDDLEKQIKKRSLRICGLPITVASERKFSYFRYDGNAQVGTLNEASMNRFEKILLHYLKQKASIIFNRWMILTVVDGRVVVLNTPMGIYRVSELIKPSEPSVPKAVVMSAQPNQDPKGNFATKIFSFGGMRFKRQPVANKVVNLQRKTGAPTASVVGPSAPVKKEGTN